MTMPHEQAAMDALRTKLSEEGLRGALVLSSTPLTMKNLDARIFYARQMQSTGKATGKTQQQIFDAIIYGKSVKEFRDTKPATRMSAPPKVRA